MKRALALIAFAGWSSTAAADPAVATSAPYAAHWHPSLETDIGDPIIFQGFQIGLGIRPAATGFMSHLRVRALFVHQVIPGFFTDMDAQDKGWENSVNLGALEVDYFFRNTGRGGFYVAPGIAFSRATLTPPDGSAPAHEWRLNLAPGAGYQWFPFARYGFYLQPWAFLIISPARLSGTSTAPNGQSFHDGVVIPALELQLGYEL